MPKDVCVGLWHTDTRAAPANPEPTWSQKADELRQKLAQVDAGFQAAMAGRNTADAIYVFVVPEYYFAMGGNYIRGYTSTEKDHIVGRLRQISAQYPDVILVPGSISWKVQLTRSERSAVAGQVRRTTSNLGPPNEKAIVAPMNEARDEIKLKGVNIKGKMASAFRWVPGVHYTPKTRWYGYNIAYVFHDGDLIGQVQKAAEAGEFPGEAPQDNVIMIPGINAGAIEVPGLNGTGGQPLKLGLEICRDASIGRLNAFGHGVLDLHVVISASTKIVFAEAREGGVYIHCDSMNPPRVAGIGAGSGKNWVQPSWTDAPNQLAVMLTAIA